MADAGRLVELFKKACSLTGTEQEAFLREVREEDSDLAASLQELLGQEGTVSTGGPRSSPRLRLSRIPGTGES